jgi:hypothetical protein
VAVGIKNKVFDDQVCYNFWSDAMVRHVKDADSIIQYEIAEGGSEALFLELRTLSSRWSAKIRVWNSKSSKVQASSLQTNYPRSLRFIAEQFAILFV